MAILEILKYGNQILRTKCSPLEKIDDNTIVLLNNMTETMYANKGIGLASIQIGIQHRILVIDLGEDEETGKKSELIKITGISPDIDSYYFYYFDKGTGPNLTKIEISNKP